MINQMWLTTFCNLVDIGHFTKTAEKLYMTQSGVSQHIRKLEAHLEVQLLIRSGKSFTVTSAGRDLYESGKALLKSMNELEARVKDDNKTSGNLSIRSPGSIGLKLYPELLKLQCDFPNLIIDYQFAPNDNIQQLVKAQKVDVGLVTHKNLDPKLSYKAIAQEELVLVAPKGVTINSWESLKKRQFINHPDAAHHANLLLSANFDEFTSIEQFHLGGFSNQIALILEPVALGLGFTVLPNFAVQAFRSINDVEVQKLPKTVFESIYLVSHCDAVKAKRVSFAEDVIAETLYEDNSSATNRR
ncbi:LysR family transcriptional regulator [Psychrosphaera sp.]|nr:LysR family transcriptional regulator [Psychrosphaera sp.]